MIYNVEHLFIWLFAICLYYLMRCLLRSLLHFSNQDIFLLFSFKNSLCILNSYLLMGVLWIFSTSVWILLPFESVMKRNFNNCGLSIISSMNHDYFGVESKKHHNVQSSIFSPMLSSRSFILVLHFTIRFMIHFELIFVNDVKSMSRLIFCIQTPSCLSTVCWKDYLFSNVLPLLLCQRLFHYIYEDQFLGSLFCSVDYCLFFLQYHSVLTTIALR